ncbi:MAG: arsenate reductase ArsC [Bdellovibrionota bacterium]
MKILFLCVANSARSQLAEGLAKNLFSNDAELQSAGSNPTQLSPLAIEAMKEIGIDISMQYSKTVNDLSTEFLADLDYAITLCAEEFCPVLGTKAKKLHWPVPDPGGYDELLHEAKLLKFRVAREAIKAKLIAFMSELNK